MFKKNVNLKLTKKTIIVIFIFILLLTAGASYLFYKTSSIQNDTLIPIPTPSYVTLKKRSLPTHNIKSVTLANKIDPTTGGPLDPTGKSTGLDKFFSQDKNIYAIIKLNNSSAGTMVEYVRYFNGKYIDHGSINVAKNNPHFIDFLWTTKPGFDRKSGFYTIKFYVQGITEAVSAYTVE